jgi:hypothetical protein
MGVVIAAAVACAAAASPAAASTCTTAADCPLPGAPCELCADGTTACPIASCTGGQCQYQLQSCPGVCGAGLTWCSLNGRCVNPACLACCQLASTCAAATDCGKACVTCANGSSSCSIGKCGNDLAGQCFYPEPVCPAAAPAVPAMPPWLTPLAGACALLGGVARLGRKRR